MHNNIIALTGCRGVGKSTISDIIVNYINLVNKQKNTSDRAGKVSFADPLRYFIRSAFSDRAGEDSIYRKNELVHTSINSLGLTEVIDLSITNRELLIATAGYLRSLDNEIFCKILRDKISRVFYSPMFDKLVFDFGYTRVNTIVIDDLRFPIEKEYLNKFRYDEHCKVFIVKINRINNENLRDEDIEYKDYLEDEECDFVIETKYSDSLEDYSRDIINKFKELEIF